MTAVVLPHRYAMMRVDQIQPHPENPNVGDVDAIAESIDEIGFYGVVLVHESTGDILAGSHRWAAAQVDGLGELPAIVIDCDADTARRIMLGDNEFARLGVWDMAKLVGLLSRVAATPRQLAATGFSAERLADLVARMTPAPPPEFPAVDDDLRTDHQCPRCGYEWSGAARPGAAA